MIQEQPYTFEPVSTLTPGDNSLLPPLSDDEYAALKADIKKERRPRPHLRR